MVLLQRLRLKCGSCKLRVAERDINEAMCQEVLLIYELIHSDGSGQILFKVECLLPMYLKY